MNLNTYALIQNKLEARGVPALLQEEEHGTTYVTITPNFGHMVRQFLRDAMIHAGILERSTDAQVVSTFRNFVVSLNVAVQALESQESVEFVRAELDKLRERIVARDEQLQRLAETRGKYADVPTSVDEFLKRKWEDEGALHAVMGSDIAPGAQMSDAEWLAATAERDKDR